MKKVVIIFLALFSLQFVIAYKAHAKEALILAQPSYDIPSTNMTSNFYHINHAQNASIWTIADQINVTLPVIKKLDDALLIRTYQRNKKNLQAV